MDCIDLIRNEAGDVLGVTAIDQETGNIAVFQAKATLFATGGAGRVYRASTNAYINTGDGLGMAARAGIPLQDMEFWQFHPTGVAGAGVLLTEGCRGEGAILRNKDGEPFMERYAPTLKDLAPRDFVSRSMDQEIKEGRGCGPKGDYILLDMTHLGAETIMKRLPSVFEIGKKFANVDCHQRANSSCTNNPLSNGWYSNEYSWSSCCPEVELLNNCMLHMIKNDTYHAKINVTCETSKRFLCNR
jgi:succinate dehydrogenase / fumarate reductase flavoprotein subunit